MYKFYLFKNAMATPGLRLRTFPKNQIFNLSAKTQETSFFTETDDCYHVFEQQNPVSAFRMM
jgi:hypothetical protein